MASVPVLVDDVKRYTGFEMTRCTYYSIACDIPKVGALDVARGRRVPFLQLGTSGLVYKPLGPKRTFRQVRQIEEIFASIEKIDDVFVDMDDIWIPNDSLPELPDGERIRGAVLRISPEAFRSALAYRAGRISMAKFQQAMTDGDAREDGTRSRPIQYSPAETKAFREWSRRIIAKAKQVYYQREALALSWDETES